MPTLIGGRGIGNNGRNNLLCNVAAMGAATGLHQCCLLTVLVVLCVWCALMLLLKPRSPIFPVTPSGASLQLATSTLRAFCSKWARPARLVTSS